MRYRVQSMLPDGRREWAVIDGDSANDVAADLVRAGRTPLQLRSGAIGWRERLDQPIAIGGGLTSSALALATEQLAILLGAGLPLEGALGLLQRQANGRATREFLTRLREAVQSGASFGAALEREKRVPAFYTGIVRSSERGGRLRHGLDDLAQALRQSETVKEQAMTALAYPAIVFLTAIFAVIFVLIKVIPEFEPTFRGHEDKLPTLTIITLRASRLLLDEWPSMLLALVLTGFGLWRLSLDEAARARLADLTRRLPGGDTLRQYVAARLLRVLGSMLVNGVPLVQALQYAQGTMGRFVFRGAAMRAVGAVRGGASFGAALAREPGFPETAIQLVEVGERSGSLGPMCIRAATLLESQTHASVQRFVALANPVAIILLGGLIAPLIMGVIMGIFSLGEFIQ